jgi:hypothetical protein
MVSIVLGFILISTGTFHSSSQNTHHKRVRRRVINNGLLLKQAGDNNGRQCAGAFSIFLSSLPCRFFRPPPPSPFRCSTTRLWSTTTTNRDDEDVVAKSGLGRQLVRPAAHRVGVRGRGLAVSFQRRVLAHICFGSWDPSPFHNIIVDECVA